MQTQYSELLKRKIVEAIKDLPRGQLKWIAQGLDVSERTLRNWKRSYPSIKKRGRCVKEVTLKEKIQIGREWKRQGFPGSRPIIHKTGLRARAVREVVSELKLRRKLRAQAHRKRVQIRTKVTKPLAFAVMDGATLKKGTDHIVYRDRATLSVETTPCYGPVDSSHTLALLENLKTKGRLPLVLGTDNGSPFCANAVKDYLRRNQVVHLLSLPHVAQQNGSAENAVGEFKSLAKQGLEDKSEFILNQCRIRKSLGWQTSSQYGLSATPFDQETRSRFYESAQANIFKAAFGTQSVYDRRKKEREAIFQTMEDFELITRTRGGLPLRAKAERIT